MTASHGRSVSIVGTGAMGAPIAGHLSAAGVGNGSDVIVYDRDHARAATVAHATDARVARGWPDVAAASVVLIVVDDDAAVVEVVDELIAAGDAVETVLVCSSVLPATVQALGTRAAEAGIGLLDAAMIGGLRGAEAGKLTLLVGGDADVLAAARAVIAPWTAAVHHLGPLGAGQVAKSANNLIHWAQVCAIDEALRLVARSGVSVDAVRTALQFGPADSRALRELEQMRFTWWRKDLLGYERLADSVGTAHPVADLCAALMPNITVDSVAELLADDPAAAG